MAEDSDLDDYPPNATLDLLLALIAELHERGVLGKHGISNMANRLDLTDHVQLAERLRMLPFSVMMERAFRDGGNEGG